MSLTRVFQPVFDFFSKKKQQKALRDEDDRKLFIQKYKAFREVLNNNNKVLMTMADMQEKASGAFIFDRAYVRSSYQAVADGVKRIIDNLNILGNGKYKDLIIPYKKNDEAIRNRLAAKIAIPKTDYVFRLKELGKEAISSAGGKLAHLGELANILGLPVPPGFVITTYAYQVFAQHNQIQDILHERTSKLDIRNYDELTATSQEMQQLVRNGQIPEDLERAILDAYKAMCQEAGEENLRVSVRSSALHEDIMASFAGQYETAMNVPAEALLAQYKNILSSQFTSRALFYYKDKEFDIEEMAMAVGVLAMVQAKASGIMYSRDPSSPQENAILINAVWGLGPYVVGGVVPTDNYRVSGNGKKKITREEAGHQEVMLVGRPEGGTQQVPVPKEWLRKPCLNNEQISELASYAHKVEAHFGQPQDMEWAMDQEGRLYLLQSRPLRVASSETLFEKERSMVPKGHKILIDKGTIACRGVGAGPVYVVNQEEDLAHFPEGGVLVVKHTHPEFAVALRKASAVVSDIGTVLGHLATVAREYNVPAIFNTENATKVLKNGMQVTVDAVYANVYEGVAEEVLRKKKTDDAFKASPVLRQLQEILQMITPLNLTDPRSPDFSPAGCKTFHDITRFAHEVSLKAMFDFSKESHFSDRSTKQLVCDVPMQWWIIDLEDGIKEGVKGKRVRPEEIVSIPMKALWEGMTALPWKGPPPVDTKGFLSVMFGAMTDPSIDPSVRKRFADKNYIIISKHFCNFSSRLGFHFSTSEAYVGDNPNENYVSFMFKGGAADVERRVRRVQFVGRLLEHFDFRTEIKDDAVLARLEGHDKEYLKERLKVLGHIIIHTRQLDMVMFNDAMVNWYYEDMLKGIKSFVNIPH
ncbi:MAG: pyruvate, water dikinase [Deltaproteobacteria bacterium]|nr:pyruvate, water dikinase [Deltaproteobacteria bacterium]MBW2019078.1 pyruvate, water dikinase [Deltaproteobacteria bacterium]MBW2073531.1 pyruvate, water dikinase [Deltaproteobacteria bacterium]